MHTTRTKGRKTTLDRKKTGKENSDRSWVKLKKNNKKKNFF